VVLSPEVVRFALPRAGAINPEKVMPEITRRSTRTRRRTIRRALLASAAAVIALSGAVTTVSLAQAAAAAELERQVVTEQLNQTTGVRTEQLGAYSDVLEARTAYQEKLEAAAAAEAAARAAYLATPAGAQETARTIAASQYGWGDDQFQCLVSLWNRESGWSVAALNASSGATGIPQALPGEKMAIAGADWATNPATQITWGLGYISSSYGTPCAAWNHSESYNWY
jgi:hypothetical protein